jgi:hypothetical protein
MKVKAPHAGYIANKIAIDMFQTGFVTFTHGRETISEKAKQIILDDIAKERAIEEKVQTILDGMEEDIEFMRADYRQLFWMTKKRIAEEEGFLLNNEDRYENISHKLLDELVNNDLIEYNVSDNMVRNSIYNSIDGYLKGFAQIEDAVIGKLENYKRKLIPGTEEYDLIYQRLYEEELVHRGMA